MKEQHKKLKHHMDKHEHYAKKAMEHAHMAKKVMGKVGTVAEEKKMAKKGTKKGSMYP